METLAGITPILGLLAGGITAHLAKSEIKTGQKYFILLQHLLLAITLGVLLWKIKIMGIIAGIVLFAVLWTTKFKHPIALTPLLAIPASIETTAQIPIFLYYIPTGTLNNTRNNIMAGIIYIIIAIFYHLVF